MRPRFSKTAAANAPGHTQFARVLYELNIDGICANTPAANGRVERAHLTLQDRLVKELRLQGISSIAAANAFMLSFITAYNVRFAKAPREEHDAHRPLRTDEDLDSIFSWRQLRKVTKDLTLHYERKLYLLADIPDSRRLIGKYLEVFQFPDRCIEIRVLVVESSANSCRTRLRYPLPVKLTADERFAEHFALYPFWGMQNIVKMTARRREVAIGDTSRRVDDCTEASARAFC